MTTTHNSRESSLRAALKMAGFNARRVTVRRDHSTLRVTVRDVRAALSAVARIAAPFESIQRCERTGEILCGGTFLDVRYERSLVAPVKASILAALEAAPTGERVTLPGGFSARKRSSHRLAYWCEVQLYGPTFEACNDIANGIEWAAERLAVAYLDANANAANAGGSVG